MKLASLHAAREVRDLRAPAGNRLEKLRGSKEGSWSIRINDQWRIVFRFENGDASDVFVEDHHR